MVDNGLHRRIESALAIVEPHDLRSALSTALGAEAAAGRFASIENAFRLVTEEAPCSEGLRYFFRSWSMTNNSAMCVSGLGNRLSQELATSGQDIGALASALVSLHRISDEDLGVGTGLLHADLFYTMATMLCGDDGWQSKQYLMAEADGFKRWKDQCSLVDDDLAVGLLSTVVHEIYTHAEVEFIRPLFNSWLVTNGWDDAARRRALLWVEVHCDGTELDHFGHALCALSSYVAGQGRQIVADEAAVIAGSYVRHKEAAMSSIAGNLRRPVGAVALD